jgi:hypothetical protein
MIRSRTTQAALLLGALLCAQNLIACYKTDPGPCLDGYVSGNCSGENPTFLYADINSASPHDTCAELANPNSPNGMMTCDENTSIPCTAALTVFYCDGSHTDTPLTGTTTEAKLGGYHCNTI